MTQKRLENQVNDEDTLTQVGTLFGRTFVEATVCPFVLATALRRNNEDKSIAAEISSRGKEYGLAQKFAVLAGLGSVFLTFSSFGVYIGYRLEKGSPGMAFAYVGALVLTNAYSFVYEQRKQRRNAEAQPHSKIRLK